MKDRTMFLRIVARALIERRGRMLVALAALIVGAAVVAAMLSVYYDAGLKMSHEVRKYGANVMLAPAEGSGFIDQSVLEEIAGSETSVQIIGAAPYLYVVAAARRPSAENDVSLVLVGTLFDQVKKVAPWWQVEGRLVDDASDGTECVVGAVAARQLGVRAGDRLTIECSVQADSRTRRGEDPGKAEGEFVVAGIVTTGAAEDDQIFARLGEVQQLAGMNDRLTAVAISAVADSSQLERFASELTSRLKGARAVPVRQIAESEGRILGKLRLTTLLVTTLILAGAVLSVGTTLTALVIERRREIGTMKAIGASDSDLLRLFLSELGALGAGGGIAGYAIGLALAQVIGMKLFNAAITPRLTVFVVVMALSLAVAVVSAIVPIRRMREVQPAVILRDD